MAWMGYAALTRHGYKNMLADDKIIIREALRIGSWCGLKDVSHLVSRGWLREANPKGMMRGSFFLTDEAKQVMAPK